MSGRRSAALARSGVGGLAALVAMGSVVLSGCGEAQVRAEDDLCAQYAGLVEQVESLADVDPDTATVEELRDQAEIVQDQLDAFQAVAEGRLDTLVSTLRTAVEGLALAVPDAGTDALDTARPLIADSLEALGEAWATLEQVADVRCTKA